jgi:kumamolisin
MIYKAYGTATTYAADYNDINYGLCGFYDGYFATLKWDPCTGIGSPKGVTGK